MINFVIKFANNCILYTGGGGFIILLRSNEGVVGFSFVMKIGYRLPCCHSLGQCLQRHIGI